MESKELKRAKQVEEALENGSLKLALKAATHLKKESPSSRYNYLVEGLIAFHHGMVDESQLMARKLMGLKPWEDGQLMTRLMIWLKRLERSDWIVDLLEQTWEVTNHSDDALKYGLALFAAYLRVEDFAKLKAFAMQLRAKTGQEKYVLWSMVATALSAMNEGKNSPATQITAQLFERMYLNKNNVATTQEFEFYINLLERLEHWDLALEVLERDTTKDLYPLNYARLVMVARFQGKAAKWEDAKKTYLELFETNMEDWDWITGYLEAVIHLIEEEPDRKDALMEQAQGLLVRAHQVKPASREVDLGSMELTKRLIDLADDQAGLMTELGEKVIRYVVRYGSKPSCFADVLSYLNRLFRRERVVAPDEQPKPPTVDMESFHQWFAKLTSTVAEASAEGNGSEDPRKKSEIVCRDITVRMIYRAAMRAGNVEVDLTQEFQPLWQLYTQGLELSHTLKVATSTERVLSDDALLLIAHYMLDHVHHKYSTDHTYRTDADLLYLAALLEYATIQSPSNAQFRLLLIKVYGHLWCSISMMEHWESLRISHIQYETLSHMMLHPLATRLEDKRIAKILQGIDAFHWDNLNTTSDFISEAFVTGSYRKVEEMLDFRRIIERSAWRRVSYVKKIVFNVVPKIGAPLAEALAAMVKSSRIWALPTSQEAVKNLTYNFDWDTMYQFNLLKMPNLGKLGSGSKKNLEHRWPEWTFMDRSPYTTSLVDQELPSRLAIRSLVMHLLLHIIHERLHKYLRFESNGTAAVATAPQPARASARGRGRKPAHRAAFPSTDGSSSSSGASIPPPKVSLERSKPFSELLENYVTMLGLRKLPPADSWIDAVRLTTNTLQFDRVQVICNSVLYLLICPWRHVCLKWQGETELVAQLDQPLPGLISAKIGNLVDSLNWMSHMAFLFGDMGEYSVHRGFAHGHGCQLVQEWLLHCCFVIPHLDALLPTKAPEGDVKNYEKLRDAFYNFVHKVVDMAEAFHAIRHTDAALDQHTELMELLPQAVRDNMFAGVHKVKHVVDGSRVLTLQHLTETLREIVKCLQKHDHLRV